MAPVTGELVFRLQRLQEVFQNITSPEQLQAAMQEAGAILAQLLQQPDLKLHADDFDKQQAAAALAEPIPRWNIGPVEHSRLALWQTYADHYSDSPRTVLHTKPAPQWTVTRRKGKKVTHTQVPVTGVVQQTNWTEDYKQQGLRYGLFCIELLAAINTVTQDKTQQAMLNDVVTIIRNELPAAIQGSVAVGNAGTTAQQDMGKKRKSSIKREKTQQEMAFEFLLLEHGYNTKQPNETPVKLNNLVATLQGKHQNSEIPSESTFSRMFKEKFESYSKYQSYCRQGTIQTQLAIAAGDAKKVFQGKNPAKERATYDEQPDLD